MPIARIARSEAHNTLRHEPKLMTVTHVAKLLGVHVRTVRRWLETGRLAGLSKGPRSYLIPRTALIDFLCGESEEGN
jgi:excisionase family DNA binding protein